MKIPEIVLGFSMLTPGLAASKQLQDQPSGKNDKTEQIQPENQTSKIQQKTSTDVSALLQKLSQEPSKKDKYYLDITGKDLSDPEVTAALTEELLDRIFEIVEALTAELKIFEGINTNSNSYLYNEPHIMRAKETIIYDQNQLVKIYKDFFEGGSEISDLDFTESIRVYNLCMESAFEEVETIIFLIEDNNITYKEGYKKPTG